MANSKELQMRKIKQSWMYLAVLVLAAGACFGEELPAPKFFKLDFVVKEVDAGRVLNSRSYSATVSTKPTAPCRIRTNSRIATPTSVDGSQLTFNNIGTNIDCGEVTDMQTALSLKVTAEVSTVLQDATPTSLASRQPVVRENRWDSTVVVPLKKPTVIFSSDDATTKHQMQLELTATLIQ
jgi:hypothetical protein